MADKKYYWLKLQKDFFKRHDIRIIEAMPNGKDYILFYLKLLVESVSHEGELRFSETIPYNEEMLSTITNTNIDVVRSAMKVFQELEMIEVLDNSTIYMAEVSKMIGYETVWAGKKRKYRETHQDRIGCDRTMSSQCPSDVRQEKEKEIEKDNNICAFWEDIWGHYPIKKGKGKVSKTQKAKLFKYGIDQMRRCVDRYVDGFGNNDRKYMMHGSTFFNSGYVDYLDENYVSENADYDSASPYLQPIEPLLSEDDDEMSDEEWLAMMENYNE